MIHPDKSQISKDAWVDLFSGYWWEIGTKDPTTFEAAHAVEYQITMGDLPNFHPWLSNLESSNPQLVLYDDSLVDPEVDPGSGAFSY